MNMKLYIYGVLVLTLRKESREPFSMYSVMIITGLPGQKKKTKNKTKQTK